MKKDSRQVSMKMIRGIVMLVIAGMLAACGKNQKMQETKITKETQEVTEQQKIEEGKETPTGYPEGEVQQPQMMYQDKIYYFTAAYGELSDEYENVGVIEKVDHLSEPDENFEGARLEEGQEVYFSNEKDVIYVREGNRYMVFLPRETASNQDSQETSMIKITHDGKNGKLQLSQEEWNFTVTNLTENEDMSYLHMIYFWKQNENGEWDSMKCTIGVCGMKDPLPAGKSVEILSKREWFPDLVPGAYRVGLLCSIDTLEEEKAGNAMEEVMFFSEVVVEE